MAHIKDVKISNNTYLIEPTVYAATAGTASAITAAVSNFALDTGVVVSLKITTANAANATLNVNNTGDKTIRYNNANIAASALKANRFYSLLYDGSYWQLLGELDTNTTYSAGTGIEISDTTISNAGVTGIKGNSESSYRTGQVNLTAANVGAVDKAGDTMTGKLTFNKVQNAIAYTGTKATYDMIKFIDNTGDTYGNGIYIGGGGATIIGGGESANVAVGQVNGGNEVLYLCNDTDVNIFTNMQNGWDSRKTFTFDSNGTLTASTFIGNLTGNVTGNVSGSAGSVAWENVTGKPSTFSPSAHTHYELATIGDQRSTATTPNTYNNRFIFHGLKTNSYINSPYTDNYSYLIGLRGWSDSSGGNSHELAFNGNGIYRRQGATTEWGNWFHLLDSNNTYAANSNGTAVSVARNTDTTIATINGVDVKIKIPASDNTWRPIGTGATDAAAGNHTHSGTYVPNTTGSNNVNTIVNTGIYNITSGSATNTPKGYGYANLLVLCYSKHTGNTTTDWASQIYLHNGGGTESGSATAPGNVLYYRTSNASSWFTWRKAVHVADTYAKVGDSTTPVYIAESGEATACSSYAGGTAVTLNNSSKAASTASFYAPTAGGTANTQALVGNGATAAPKWVDISPSITIGAGTGSAAPTVNVTVLGQSGTAQSITTASTSVYGVTKLNDGIASNSTALAATANSALVAAKKVASSNSTSKLYLVGATSQSTTGVDSYSYQYTYTNNGLLSALKVGLNLNGTEKAHLEWNNDDQTIDFVFA